MTSQHNFDYDGFLRAYRAACARHGIDPARGASGYQVVHLAAERQRRAWRPDRWWQRHDLWLNCAPYRSETEQEAIWNVFTQTYGIMAGLMARAIRLRRTALALRDLHQARRK